VINQVAKNLSANKDCGIATLSEPLNDYAELMNPNIVKVVQALDGKALYFSRAPVPWHRDGFVDGQSSLQGTHWQRHIGIYAYRVNFLKQYVSWPVAPLEEIEALEQLRALYHGVAIHVQEACEQVPGGIDTETDLIRMRELLGG
jgi:3-deoxy-manno-octulosonate cytidylyltransferase (CMP-KDO synthetase)